MINMFELVNSNKAIWPLLTAYSEQVGPTYDDSSSEMVIFTLFVIACDLNA